MTKEEQRDWVRACVHFVVHFLQDGVKEVFLAGLELVPLLVHFVHQSPADVALILDLEKVYFGYQPILLKRSGEGVPSLEDARSVAKSSRVKWNTRSDGQFGYTWIGSLPKRSPLYYIPRKKRLRLSRQRQKVDQKAFNVKRGNNHCRQSRPGRRLEKADRGGERNRHCLAGTGKQINSWRNTFTLIEIGLKHSNSSSHDQMRQIIGLGATNDKGA